MLTINFIESKEEEVVEFNDLKLSFDKTVHSGENLAVKIADGKNTFAFSGDGSPKSGNDFYAGLDLLILETYLYDKEIIGHSSMVSAIKFAENNGVKCLALTHINRDYRKNDLFKMKDKLASGKVKIIIPKPLEEYNF
ncbi:MAG: MBL fold metallo-hydrolase [Candidatus Nealsonbacteria bacterium]|nr:MBL fold metallo-hydrolase [Candidatus Nealsonbacteria bacterium]